MQAVQYDAYGAAPDLVDIPAPDCPADGVLIEVRATGVCRSDWHAWQGHDPVPCRTCPVTSTPASSPPSAPTSPRGGWVSG